MQEGLKRLFLPMRVGLRVAAGAVLGFRLLSVPLFPTFDEDRSGDEDGEEDDVDEDSLLNEEDVDEYLPMEDGISATAGLVFAPKDLAE